MTAVTPQALARWPLLEELEAAQLEVVAQCARYERQPKGRLLLHQGAPADALHLLCSGSASLELEVPGREPLVLQTLGPGELVGASWLLSDRVQFDVRARTDLETIRFDTACLLQRFEADPALGYAFCRRFMAVVVERLQAARLQLMDLYGHPATLDEVCCQ